LVQISEDEVREMENQKSAVNGATKKEPEPEADLSKV
jgi:hypothetical protein